MNKRLTVSFDEYPVNNLNITTISNSSPCIFPDEDIAFLIHSHQLVYIVNEANMDDPRLVLFKELTLHTSANYV